MLIEIFCSFIKDILIVYTMRALEINNFVNFQKIFATQSDFKGFLIIFLLIESKVVKNKEFVKFELTKYDVFLKYFLYF